MRRKKVWRYYCDHCGKGGCGGWQMEKHELHCTLNPERDCRMCAHDPADETIQHKMPVLIDALGSGDKEGLQRLRDMTGGDSANGCPACILSAIRQAGLSFNGPNRKMENIGSKLCKLEVPTTLAIDSFNYKEEVADFWREHNSHAADYERY